VAFVAATAFTGLWTGLISVYGKRAISIAMTGVLAFVFAMGQRFTDPGAGLDHFVLFACGAILYATYALAAAYLFDDRARRLLLAEAMRAFVAYLRAKAALYNPDSAGPAPFRALIDAHAVLADRLQAARDSLLARRRAAMQLKRIDVLIALLDAFETVLSSDSDMELLRHARARDLLWRFNKFVHLIADEVEGLTLVLRNRRGHTAQHRHSAQGAELVAAVEAARKDTPGDGTLQAFASTANKLVLADQYVAGLARALDNATPPSRIAAELDLSVFQQEGPRGVAVLLRQFRYRSPALRYAVRLSLAMTAGLGLTLRFPHFAHANWVLLTIALVMRANYSVTRRRRWDRITGTLAGCALAVLFINTLPPAALLVLIVLAVGTSHAYGGVMYRVTAISASVTSLLLLHFVDPLVHPQFFERIVDTLIGAGLSWAFSFLLPHWERNDLPGTVKTLLAADAAFVEAALRRTHVHAQYRLARKRALDAVAHLSGALRRLADEPNINRRALAALAELLGANYLLAADLTSMPVLLKLRAPGLDASADAAIAQARGRIVALLAPGRAARDRNETAPDSPRAGEASVAMDVLARRLDHIERAARKVARLAARPVLENL
jgi:uncharacterized membrane protein YccC